MLCRFLFPAALACATPALAQGYDENPTGRSLFAQADLRLLGSDGEASWLAGGFGKTRFGGASDGDFRVRPRAVEADLAWQPQLTWSIGATLALVAQDGQQHPVDLSEAYLSYRHDAIGRLRLSARAGLLWPPVSTEHSGPAWGVTETITPSAINSWIGEEVKVVAGEVSASLPVGGDRVTGTVAVFGFNDTAGTLLAFRGWALHDEKATAFGLQQLPPLDDFMQYAQAPRTRPIIELDNRPGFYGRIAWRNPTLTLAAFYYDNRGDPEAVDAHLQWGWRTRFANLSAIVTPGAKVTLTAQAMSGSTQMGYPFGEDGRIWVDTRFRSAFLLATRRIGASASVSGRVEAFGTRGRGSVLDSATDEDGWAATVAARRDFGEHVSARAEILHVRSTRDERTRVGLDPMQDQTTGQVSLRLTI